MSKFLTIAIIALSINAFAQQWSMKTPMPTARHAPGVAIVNDIIYVIGGSLSNSPSTLNVSTVEAYDPLTNTWSTKASMSVPRAELGVGVVNGKIYAIGGYNSSAVNVVEEYDPNTNTWLTKAPMPTTRSLICVGVINNKIYVVGGWPGDVSTLEEYDPSTNTWSTKAPCSTGRNQINSCVILNNNMYYIGGKNDANTIWYQYNEAYDPITNTWTSYTVLPQPRFAGATTVFDNEIHYLGGTTSNFTPNYNSHFIYNTTTDSWSNGLPMLDKRSRHVAATVNNKIYVIGGLDSTGMSTNLNEEYSIPCSVTVYDTVTTYNTIITYDTITTYNTITTYDTITTYVTVTITDTLTIYDTITSHISVTDTLFIDAILTGVNPPNNINTIKVYPNPASTHIYIDNGNFSSMNGYTVRIDDILGQTVFEQQTTQQLFYIDLSGWSGKGTYFVNILDNMHNIIDTRKIILR